MGVLVGDVDDFVAIVSLEPTRDKLRGRGDALVGDGDREPRLGALTLR